MGSGLSVCLGRDRAWVSGAGGLGGGGASFRSATWLMHPPLPSVQLSAVPLCLQVEKFKPVDRVVAGRKASRVEDDDNDDEYL